VQVTWAFSCNRNLRDCALCLSDDKAITDADKLSEAAHVSFYSTNQRTSHIHLTRELFSKVWLTPVHFLNALLGPKSFRDD